MNFWTLMLKKDDWICSIVNSMVLFKSYFNFRQQSLLYKMKQKEPCGKDKNIYIVLNGPSLETQDLNVLKGKTVMFVNRGFMHPLYKELKPEFHVFIDPKMLTGEWPVTWIDEILALSPEITFIMPVKWAFVEKFQPYIKKGIKFYWLSLANPCNCLGVAGSCFEFAIRQKFKNIYFTGFDANGIAHEIVRSSSHFYGINEENLKKTTMNYSQDLFMHSRHFRDLNKFANYCKRNQISITNFTNGGILDMFPRKNISEI